MNLVYSIIQRVNVKSGVLPVPAGSRASARRSNPTQWNQWNRQGGETFQSRHLHPAHRTNSVGSQVNAGWRSGAYIAVFESRHVRTTSGKHGRGQVLHSESVTSGNRVFQLRASRVLEVRVDKRKCLGRVVMVAWTPKKL